MINSTPSIKAPKKVRDTTYVTHTLPSKIWKIMTPAFLTVALLVTLPGAATQYDVAAQPAQPGTINRASPTYATQGEAMPWTHPDGTTHSYEAVAMPAGITWTDASAAADSAGGYLATTTSQEENDFVFDLINTDEFWHERPNGILAGPWLGGRQPDGSAEPDGGWEWITGEVFSFVNWSPGAPDNMFGDQDRIHFGETVGTRVSTWDDADADDSHLQGYVIEYDGNPGTTGGGYSIEQTLSDEAQRNTIAFDGLAFLTGSLGADSFLPPGKVADFWGLQYLRDNDPSEMGHNTDFLTKAANNALYILTDDQVEELVALAEGQVDAINLYAYDRFVLMQAFRRLLEEDLPEGAGGRNDLYEIVDTRGQVATELRRFMDGDSPERDAVLSLMERYGELDGEVVYNYASTFAEVGHSLSSNQEATLANLRADAGVSEPVGAYLYSEPMVMPDIADTDFLFAVSTTSLTYPIVDTGQITCYSNSGSISCPQSGGSFYGQDAQHAGNPAQLRGQRRRYSNRPQYRVDVA